LMRADFQINTKSIVWKVFEQGANIIGG
jgi:hypothetical protein